MEIEQNMSQCQDTSSVAALRPGVRTYGRGGSTAGGAQQWRPVGKRAFWEQGSTNSGCREAQMCLRAHTLPREPHRSLAPARARGSVWEHRDGA